MSGLEEKKGLLLNGVLISGKLLVGLDKHDSMLDEMSSIHAIMYQKGAHEKRYAEKRHNYHNCTDYYTSMVYYAVHVGLLPSTGNGRCFGFSTSCSQSTLQGMASASLK